MTFFPEIDLANPEHFVAGTPHHWFRKLRAEAPVYFHPEPAGGPGFWCVTKYEDLRLISRKLIRCRFSFFKTLVCLTALFKKS